MTGPGRAPEAPLPGSEDLGGVQADHEGKAARTSGIESGGGIDHDQDAGAIFELLPRLDVDRRPERCDDY